MKKILSALTLVALLAACSNENEPLLVSTETETYSVTGYSDKNVNTRTYFYENWITGENPDYNPFDTGLVFLWHEDDFIWIDDEQSTDITIEDDESATFGGFSTDPAGKVVYYNTSGDSPNIAYVRAEQDVNDHLGINGDFAYATLEAYEDGNFFELTHATSYIWFDVLDLLNEYDNDGNRLTDIELVLESITLDAGVNIAGKATWNGTSFGEISEGSSKITLNVGKTIPDTETLFPMVVFPVNLTGKNVNITYKFTVDGEIKFYQQVLQGKELIAGVTQLVIPEYIDENTSESLLTDYRLRVMTFEDADAQFEEYSFTGGDGNLHDIATWSDLIPAEDKQNYLESPLIYANPYPNPCDAEYTWWDLGNTELGHMFPYNYDTYNYAGGGMVVSSHTVPFKDLTQGNIYDYQVSVTTEGGHNGSENFCVAYNASEVDYDASGLFKNTLYFSDGVARVLDHMYVTIAAPTHYCITYGNGYSKAFKDGDFLKLVATGIKEDDTKTTPVEIMLAEGADMKLTDWTKWDLSDLGEVVAVEFHMEEAQISYDAWYCTPFYFAFDDVAVRFTE